MIDLSTAVAGVRFGMPLYNASGPRCTSLEELISLILSTSSAALIKTTTWDESDGNPEPKYWTNGEYTINSNGLQNPGFREYLRILPEVKEKNPEKLIIPSIAIKDSSQAIDMIGQFAEAGFDFQELNVSCPNVIGNPKQLAYKFDDLNLFLETLREVFPQLVFGLKLPFYRVYEFTEIDQILIQNQVNYITVCNSLPNCTDINLETLETVIHPNEGEGGLGGPALLYPVLAQVKRHYKMLRGIVDIVAVGGIRSAEDVIKYAAAGAAACQIGSSFSIDEFEKFSEINIQLTQILSDMGVEKFSSLIGKLKIAKANS